MVVTVGPDGMLYDWRAGVRITPEGAEAIDYLALTQPMCPVCLRRAPDGLVSGVCAECSTADEDDHGGD